MPSTFPRHCPSPEEVSDTPTTGASGKRFEDFFAHAFGHHHHPHPHSEPLWMRIEEYNIGGGGGGGATHVSVCVRGSTRNLKGRNTNTLTDGFRTQPPSCLFVDDHPSKPSWGSRPPADAREDTELRSSMNKANGVWRVQRMKRQTESHTTTGDEPTSTTSTGISISTGLPTKTSSNDETLPPESTFTTTSSSSETSSSSSSSSQSSSTSSTTTTTTTSSSSSSSSSSLSNGPSSSSSSTSQSSISSSSTQTFITRRSSLSPSTSTNTTFSEEPPRTQTQTSTTTRFTTLPPTSPGTTTTITRSTSSGVLNSGQPIPGSRFSQNKGGIIGISVGGVVFVIALVILLFFLCKRWRQSAVPLGVPGGLPMTTDFMGDGPGGGGALAAGVTRSFSKGATSAGSSRRMLMRDYSFGETGQWRPPLSDEDVGEEPPPPLPKSPSTIMAVGGMGIGNQGYSSSGEGEELGNVSVSGHGHSSIHSNLHDHPYILPNTTGSAVEVGRKPSVGRQNTSLVHMPGFGQAAEHMHISGGVVDSSRISPTTPTSPIFSIPPPGSPTFSSAKTGSPSSPSPPSAYTYMIYGSSSSHSYDHSSSGHLNDDNGLGEYKDYTNGGSASLKHTNTLISVGSHGTSSSGSHSQSHSQSLSHTHTSPSPTLPSVPRIRIHEASAFPKNTASKSNQNRNRRESTSSLKGFIMRLRGGGGDGGPRTSSGQDSNLSRSQSSTFSGVPSPPPAASFYYPPTATARGPPSSLLNPPLPPLRLVLPPPPAFHGGTGTLDPMSLPLPSPVPTEGSSDIRVTEGLLDPQLLAPLSSGAGSGVGVGGLSSLSSETARERELDGSAVSDGGLGATPSMASLGDHVDYSRPYRGFVFNQMGSSATFATQDTTTTTQARTSVVDTPVSFRVDGATSTVGTIEEGSEYPFGIAR